MAEEYQKQEEYPKQQEEYPKQEQAVKLLNEEDRRQPLVTVVLPNQERQERAVKLLNKEDRRKPWVAIVLTLFLGDFGIQYFYLRKTTAGVLSLIFCWTFIPAIVAFFFFFRLLIMSKSEFDMKYNLEIS